MRILETYQTAWTNRGFIVPVLLGVRLISLGILAPIIGLSAQLAVRMSGQGALTDQDIAYFILSPAGFPVFLAVTALILIGTVVGFAVITIDLATPGQQGLKGIPAALRQIARRLPALMPYAVQLVLRILAIVAPFAALGVLVAHRMLGAYDINFYLSEHPPEFLMAVAIGAGLALVCIPLLVSKLLSWAVSLHLVLLGQAKGRVAFAASSEAMEGKRIILLKDLVLWYAIRAGLGLLVGAVFVWILKVALNLDIGGFEVKLTMALLIVSLWAITDFVVGAISLGALAQLLGAFYTGPDALPAVETAPAPGLTSPAFLAVGVVGVLAVGAVTATELLSDIRSDQEVLVIAHRGAAGAFPENTLASVRGAVDAGADWVEIDVQETADGEVVVVHDSDFMKLSAVDLKVWDATMAELAEIDIGSWFDTEFADARVPTLAQVLDVTRDRAKLLIELKYYGHDVDLEARTIAIVEAAGLADQVATMSLKYPAVQKMKATRPDWPSGVLAATAVGNLSRLEGEFIAVSSNLVTPRLLRQAHGADKKVFAWTVNDPLEMMGLVSLGVDGLITDEPARARATLAERAELQTHERIFLVFLDRFGLVDSFAQQGRDDSP